MVIVLHIIIALTSILYSGFIVFRPTRRKLLVSYGLVLLTLLSGVLLVVLTNSPILAACTSGLVYLSTVLTTAVAAHRRLPTEK